MAGREVIGGYRPTRIEDVDTAVVRWFDGVVDAHVQTPTEDRYKVPVVFAAGERWATEKENAGLRDASGRLILPVISVVRTSVDPATNMTALGVNVPRLTVARRVSAATRDLKNAVDVRRVGLRRKEGAVVYDLVSVPFPTSNTIAYRVVVHGSYILQVNAIIEKIQSQLEYFQVPCFVATLDHDKPNDTRSDWHRAPYEERKPLTGYYFVCFFDPGMNDEGNFEEFTDQERIVKYSATFRTYVALNLDAEGNQPAYQVERTAFDIGFDDEQVVLVEDPDELIDIFGS